MATDSLSSLSEKVIQAELNYIRDTINQGLQDRYQIMTFYISIFGALGSIVLGLISLREVNEMMLIGAGVLSFLAGILGIIFWLTLRRLRQAWRESLVVLNKIKDEAISLHPELESIFSWSSSTIPATHKLNTVHFYSASIIGILTTFSFIASMLFITQLDAKGFWLLLGLAGLSIAIYFGHELVYTVWYRR